VRVLLVGDESRLTPDAAVNLGALRLTEIPVDRLESKDEQVAFERVRDWLAEFRPALVVDALLGTGLSRDVEGAPAGVIRAINVARKEKQTSRVVSLDVPSGLDADEGRALGVAVKADATATFAALKRGFFALEAQAYVGEIDLLPIGVPPELTLRFGRPVDTRATACFREEPLRSGQAAPGDPRGAGRDAGGGEPDGSRR
jgi:NAD(P)H-hydrate epimerase